MYGTGTFGRSLLVGGWLLGLALPRSALADEPAPATTSLPGVAQEKALQTFKEGIAAFDRRDFEAARVAFLQTFALKPSAPVVRRNLGLAEIYSGYYLEGARRLARVIHTTDEGTPQDRARMLESLKKAEAYLERVTLEVNVEGAQIVVDDVDLGISPLPFAWYVAPGSYTVRVSKAGHDTFSETRLARPGTAQHLRVALKAPAPVSPPLAPLPPADMESGSGPNPWLVAAGGALTVSGVAAGLTLSLLAADNADKVDRLGEVVGAMGCGEPMPQQCTQISSAAETHDRQVRWATVSFAGAAVAGVSTLLYALIASTSDHPEDASAPRAASDIEPMRVGLGLASGEARLWLHTGF